jgi:hypothetical protein
MEELVLMLTSIAQKGPDSIDLLNVQSMQRKRTGYRMLASLDLCPSLSNPTGVSRLNRLPKKTPKISHY